MEPEVVKIERRGRKRKRNDVQSAQVGDDSKKKVAPIVPAVPGRSTVLIGRYMTKEFEGNDVFIGKVVSYDRGLYRVDYENGDCEEVESGEVKAFLVEEEDMDDDFCKRKKSLDEHVVNKYAKDEVVQSASVAIPNETPGHVVELVNLAVKVGNLSNGGEFEVSGAENEVDCESSSDLSDYDLSGDYDPAEVESITASPPPPPPPPRLPPSSGNIGVSEEHASYLLSVYSFLRSFSVCLFLSPFGLDEFVGALNSSVRNTLLDAIHVALMRALKSRLEMLASEGLEVASKCLRSMNWSFLDSLTWPVFLVQYLTTMRYTEGSEWKEFCAYVLERDYYTLCAKKKLTILQLLCDDALDSTEVRVEIDMREESEVGSDPESTDESVSRISHLRYPKTSLKNDCESHMETPSSSANSLILKTTKPNTGDEDGNGDECRLCGMDGTLLCCDGCPSVYHARCIGVSKLSIPKGAWYCLECSINKIGPNVARLTSLRGAVFFGVDPYDQVFFGTCDHLLVTKGSGSLEQCFRYYAPNEIQKVLCALNYSVESMIVYSEICKGISQYWEIPEDILPLTQSVGLDKEGSSAPELLNSKGVLSGVTVIKSEDITAPSTQENCTKRGFNRSSLSKEVNQLAGNGRVYMGLSFKPQTYLNLYNQGDFAASAASSLAVLSSERASEPQSSRNRKTMSAIYSLQIKAFSLAAKRFYWPNHERKLVEVPRERCGWCLSCKTNIKRGCLLNASALSAIKGDAKMLASLRPSKNVEGGLASIAIYVMFMEESLCGLTVGPFRSPTYRKYWHKQVEQAATLSAIKTSLLEFEGSIRSIAFSADWANLVDDMSLESPATQSASSVVGSTQRPGPGRRRGRKPSRITEVTTADSEDVSTGFAWWRGGMLSKRVFHKGILPQLIIKNAARQGGCGKIDGVHYLDGFEVPKRSRQFVWRAAVETSKTVSQLALQVRHLDDHVRWNDLVHPEQPQDGKGTETEASAFRNACIVDKKVVENQTRYGVVFENQKHLPSRVLKNILEVEESVDGKEKYWLIETYIPLYLIKEYEKNVEEGILLSTDEHVDTLSNLERKRLKVYGKNIFSFLSTKRDNLGKCLCTSCQLDISFRNAARCSACQGYCHKQCTISSTIRMKEHVNFSITCKQCHHEKTINSRNDNMANSPTSPLLLRGQEGQPAVTAINGGKHNGYRGPLESLDQSSKKKLTKNGKQKGKNGQSSELKPQKSKSKLPLGLRWKKKNSDDTGIDFRLKNILLKNNPNRNLLAPQCYICTKPYNPDLMYICCETCKKWCHAEALELKESKILDLVGFKCCRCRRMRSPICPYMDPETKKKLLEKYPPLTAPTQPNLLSDSISKIKSEPLNNRKFNSINILKDNSRLLSFPKAEQVNEQNSGVDSECGSGPVSGPHKLPIRRHNDLDFENTFENTPNPCEVTETLTLSMDGFEEDLSMDMKFEPQTYFSFKELLASSDDGADPEEVKTTSNWDVSSAALLTDRYQMSVSYDNQEPMFSVESGADIVFCGVCSKAEPSPDFCCGICGLWIHNYCSPWDEETGGSEGGWRCGNCRDWRQ